jgi:hypothetical protein
MTLTVTDITSTARAAAQKYFDEKLGGRDQYACGFAWVNIKPKHKGNTKLGKVERVELRAMGFEVDWTGKEFQMWNPSKMGCQNVDTLYVGAQAAARLLQEHGYEAYAGSRLD